MNADVFRRGRSPFQRLWAEFPMDNQSFEMLKDVMSLGCICSTSMASPILFEFRVVWLIDVFVFFLSSAAFMLQNEEEVKTYGPYTLVAVTFLGLAAYSSARTTLRELVPWLPTAICLFILLTVYFLPKLSQPLNGDVVDQVAMEEGRFYGTPVEPGSVRSEASSPRRPQSLEVEHWLAQETSHAGGGTQRPGSRNSARQSIRDSDIDLGDTSSVTRLINQRMVSPSRPVYNVSNLPQTASENGFTSQRFAAAKPVQPTEGFPRTPTLNSIAVEGPSSTSAESKTPLLG